MNPANQAKFDEAAKYAIEHLNADAGASFQLIFDTNIEAAEHSFRLVGPGHDNADVAYNQVMRITLDDDGTWEAYVETLDAKGNAYRFDAPSSTAGWDSFEAALDECQGLAEQQMDIRESEVAYNKEMQERQAQVDQDAAQDESRQATAAALSARDDELRFIAKQEFADAIQQHAKSKGLEVGVTFDNSSIAVSYPGSNTSTILEQLSPAELDAAGWDHDNEPRLIMQPRIGAIHDIGAAHEWRSTLDFFTREIDTFVAQSEKQAKADLSGHVVEQGLAFKSVELVKLESPTSPLNRAYSVLQDEMGDWFSRDHNGTMQVLVVQDDGEYPGKYWGQLVVDFGTSMDHLSVTDGDRGLDYNEVVDKPHSMGARYAFIPHATIERVVLQPSERDAGHGIRNAELRIKVLGYEHSVIATFDKAGKHLGFTPDGAAVMERVVEGAGWTGVTKLLAQVADAIKEAHTAEQAARGPKSKSGKDTER